MEQQKENTTADIRFDNTIRFALVTTLLVLLLLAGLFLNISIGSVSISVGNVFRMLSDGIRWYVKNLFSGGKYVS